MHNGSSGRIDGAGVVGQNYRPMSPRKTGRPTSLRLDPDTETLAFEMMERRRLKSLTELVRALVNEEAERKKIYVATIAEKKAGKK